MNANEENSSCCTVLNRDYIFGTVGQIAFVIYFSYNFILET